MAVPTSRLRSTGTQRGHKLTASALYEGKAVGNASAVVSGPYVKLTIPLSEVHLWEVGQARLYDLELSLQGQDQVCDTVQSYFGLRTVMLDGMAFRINGKSVFQRLVLDQGFYPDGVYTAPSDEDLRKDIEISMGLGFNGARLHEKMFEPRFLYWADRLGYLVWGEHANWGLDITTAEGCPIFCRNGSKGWSAISIIRPSSAGVLSTRRGTGTAPSKITTYCALYTRLRRKWTRRVL